MPPLMSGADPVAADVGWKLAITALFLIINAFFVAAEFAFVKVRAARLDALGREGNSSARVASGIAANLDLYLSACQLGITASSLVLGWLAEPAVADLPSSLDLVRERVRLHALDDGLDEPRC